MIYLILYLINGFVTIYAENAGYVMMMYVSKVLMMPLLALYLYSRTKDIRPNKFIYLALFFSWWGDIFLMFPRNDHTSDNAKLLFICGLVSFLIGHLNYIAHFINEMKKVPRVSILVEKPFLVFPFLLFIILLLKLLYPTLGPMKVPVTVYACIITFMLLMAFNRLNLVRSVSYYHVLIGAILFVFSDTSIAINLFYKPFEEARILIMSTYIVAQLLIVHGILKNSEKVIS